MRLPFVAVLPIFWYWNAAAVAAAATAVAQDSSLLDDHEYDLHHQNSHTILEKVNRKTERGHTTPTVLSVYDEKSSSFVNALSNGLYEELISSSTTFHVSGGLFRGREKSTTTTRRKVNSLPIKMHADKMDGIKFGDSVELIWDDSDKNHVGDDDMIALYCPAEEANPRKFRDAATISQVKSTVKKHAELQRRFSGDFDGDGGDKLLSTHRRRMVANHNAWWIPSFPIVRSPTCEFRMWNRSRNSSHAALTLAGRTGPIPLSLSLENPTSIHMALTSDPTQMTVQFTTGALGKPVAQYGSTSDLTMRSEGSSTTYQASDMCQPPANTTEPGKFIDPGQLHTVTLTNLVPDTKYSYRVGLASGQGIVWSSTFSFHTPLPAGSNQTHSFIIYGDQGCPDDGWALGANLTADMVRRELDEYEKGNPNRTLPVRLVHHIGDLSYARGSAYLWDAWLNMIQPFAARIPLMVGVGNHEYDHTAGGLGKDPSGVNTDDGFRPSWGNFATDSGGECGVPTAKRFLMPQTTRGNHSSSNGVFWYSFDYGMVHTIMISSEHDLSKGSKQHVWLKHDLRSLNRTVTPWVIVESHRPMYHAKPYWSDNSVGIAMRAEFEDLVRKNSVDVFFAGHYHSYLRTCDGLYGSICNNGGPTHITVGTAGAHLDDESLGLYDNVWTEKYLAVWGYGRVTVHSATTMMFEFVNANNGAVEDQVLIRRKRRR